MRDRSGPQYELSKRRSAVISAAYRAAGRPQRVQALYTGERPPEPAYAAEWRLGYWRAWTLPAVWKREQRIVYATREEVEAWHAWTRERTRLYRELGWVPKRRQHVLL